MTLLGQMALQAGVGFAIGAGTNELAIRWVFNALFTKKKRLIAENAPYAIFQLVSNHWCCKDTIFF